MQSLVDDIEAFLKMKRDAGRPMTESYFSKLAAGYGQFLDRLRAGSQVYPSTEKRVRDYIAVETEKQKAMLAAEAAP